ncbi:MAG: hypothetical protein WB795_06615, partial [Candidatus Acidiferrales bacterium]
LQLPPENFLLRVSDGLVVKAFLFKKVIKTTAAPGISFPRFGHIQTVPEMIHPCGVDAVLGHELGVVRNGAGWKEPEGKKI